MSALYHHLIEPALVGGGVLFALGMMLRRFVPRRRPASGAACSSCSGCGGCASAAKVEPEVKPIVVTRKPAGSQPRVGGTPATD